MKGYLIFCLMTAMCLISTNSMSSEKSLNDSKQIMTVEKLNDIGQLLTQYHKKQNKKLHKTINEHLEALREQNDSAFQYINDYCQVLFDKKRTVEQKQQSLHDALVFIREFANEAFADSIGQLQKNTADLKEQEIKLAELYRKIDALVDKKLLSPDQALRQKELLKNIVEANKQKTVQQSSYVSRLGEIVKSPVEWAYSKVFDQNASYLQRAAWAAVIAAGTIVIGTTLYYGASGIKNWFSTPESQGEQLVEELPQQRLSEASQVQLNENDKNKKEVGSENATQVVLEEAGTPAVAFKDEMEQVSQPSNTASEKAERVAEVAEELREMDEELREFQKFVQKYAPPEEIKKILEENEDLLLHGIWTGVICDSDGSNCVYTKGNKLSRASYGERLVKFMEEEGMTTVGVPKKWIHPIGNEYRVFAEKIEGDKGREFTPAEQAELKKIAEAGFWDWDRGRNLIIDKKTGKIMFIDTERGGFRKESQLRGLQATRYDDPDIDVNQALFEANQRKKFLQEKDAASFERDEKKYPFNWYKLYPKDELERKVKGLERFATGVTIGLNIGFGEPGSEDWVQNLTEQGFRYDPTTNTMEKDLEEGHYVYDINTKTGTITP